MFIVPFAYPCSALIFTTFLILEASIKLKLEHSYVDSMNQGKSLLLSNKQVLSLAEGKVCVRSWTDWL